MYFSSKKRLFLFATAYFPLYLIGALLFFKERIFLDGTYYFFHVVQAENFWVEHQRFILIPSQILLLAGVKLHLPLQLLLILDSLNPVLYLFTIFFICFWIFGDKAAGWALLFLGVCGVYFLYFCPMYEVWYGAALLIFFSSLINKHLYHNPGQLVLVAITAVTLLFSYPLMIIGFLFILLYHFFEIRKVPFKLTVVLGAVCIFWIICKILFISDYETGKIGYPWSQMAKIAKENLGSVANVKALIMFLIRIYTEELVAFFIVTLILVYRRKYEIALLTIFLVVGFILLINITQNMPWQHSNYYERMYLLLIPMCLIPFLHEVYQSARRKLLFELVFIGIIFFRGAQIVQHQKSYAERITTVEYLIEKAKKKGRSKFYVDQQKHEGNSALNEWSFPMETLIFSSLKGIESIVISPQSDVENPEISNRLTSEYFHLRLDEIMKTDELNPHYFHLKNEDYRSLD